MNRSIALIVVVIVFIFSMCNFAYSVPEDKLITRINGTVEGRKGKDVSWFPIFTSRNLTDGDWAKTGLDSLAKIYIGGDRHFVKLYENTMVEMSKVELKNENIFIKLKQTLGRIKVNFDKYSGKTQTMEVDTPTATLAVHGTSFFSWVLNNGQTILRVLSGAVRVTPTAGGTSFHVHAGHDAVITPHAGGAHDSHETPSVEVHNSPSNENVSSSNLVDDNLPYTGPNQKLSVEESTGITDSGTSYTANTSGENSSSANTTTTLGNTAVQSTINTGETLHLSFNRSLSNSGGPDIGSGPNAYDFVLHDQFTFNGTTIEGKLVVNINSPALNKNQFNGGEPRIFEQHILPINDTVLGGAPTVNIDSNQSIVKGKLSYFNSGPNCVNGVCSGYDYNNMFTIGLSGDIALRLYDPAKPFAAFFILDDATTTGIFDSGRNLAGKEGKVVIGGVLVDESSTSIFGNIDTVIKKGGQPSPGVLFIKVRNPYTLPINGFGQSH